jgi:transcriptional antiterminator RfaH
MYECIDLSTIMIPDIYWGYNIEMEFHTDIWYLVMTKPRMEEMAEINLKNQSIEYFLPRFTNGKREGKVIFPEYIFIKPKMGNTYQAIRSTRGVSDFVRFEMAFANVSDETIDELKEVVVVMNDRMDQTNLHQKGEEVFIKSGPFKDFNVIFEKYDADKSVIVLINFLRHQQRVKIKAKMIA